MFVALWPIPTSEIWWRLLISVTVAFIFGFFQTLFKWKDKSKLSVDSTPPALCECKSQD